MGRTRAWERARAAARWAGRHVELRLAAALAVAGGLMWGFAELTGDVLERDTHAFDAAVLLALREPSDLADPLGPAWMHEAARDITALGSIAVLTLLVVAAVGYLWVARERTRAWALLAGVGGAALGVQLAKDAFVRPRPDVVPHLAEVYTASFPSGHSTMSAAVYLVTGMLLAAAQRRVVLRAYIMLVAIVIVVLVGVSRVYVGVHWPTDVLAGWTLGTAWSIVVFRLSVWREKPRARRAPPAKHAHA